MAAILIVDDLAANRELLVTLLRYQGHRLLEAADGAAGLALARAERPEVVITDVLMPVMDGYELLRQLRLDPATAAIPVVFYTAHYGEREARALALSSGVAHVLTKPTEPEEVLRVVGEILAGAVAREAPFGPPRLDVEFDRDHLRLLTDKLSEKEADLRGANARLRALINIGLELASERDGEQLLRKVCTAPRDLFGASYVTLGIVERGSARLQRLVTEGVEAGGWIHPGDEVTGTLRSVVAERRIVRGEETGDAARPVFPPGHPPARAFLAAPIASPAHVYGWLCLVSNEGRAFTEADEQLVMALAGQVGRIYENGYFYAVAQKRADELREERDRAQHYLDTAGVILLALDREGRVTLVNRYGCSLLGWSADELIGQDWIERCHPARLRGVLVDALRQVLEGGLIRVEFPVLCRSGEERLIEWHHTLLRDPGGRVVGTFSSGADITERTAAVQALRSAEERMRFALQNAEVGIWDIDFTTGTLQWSEILESQFGLAPGSFGGDYASFLRQVHPDDRPELVAIMDEAVRSGKDFTVQHRAVRPDGTLRWLNGAGRILLDELGNALRGVGISLDVTERHTLEEQYQQAQKMEAIGQLAGGVAHDFNNLLTAILGYCELLRAELDPGDPRRADVAEIERAGTRAAGLTRQLLAFSRKEMVEPRVLDLNGVVTEMRGLLGRLIREDVRVVLELAPAPALLLADRGQVEQVVMNLAVNAQDAMPRGGTLTIQTALADLGDDYAAAHPFVRPGAYVALIVTDTGTGMTPEVRARLFEPFFTTKEVGRGTGLGLATVHGIVMAAGGSVSVASEPGRGATFQVLFPRADGAEVTAEPPAPELAAVDTGQTVLVVEDADELRELARRLLERQGYTVRVAANADEALRRFEEGSAIDVLLTDVVMPGASGPELTRRLLERWPALRVIYMSGYTEDTIVEHGVLNPGIGFLRKPFSSEALGRKLREVLDSSPVGEPAATGAPLVLDRHPDATLSQA